jgi:hypothetical protein
MFYNFLPPLSILVSHYSPNTHFCIHIPKSHNLHLVPPSHLNMWFQSSSSLYMGASPLFIAPPNLILPSNSYSRLHCSSPGFPLHNYVYTSPSHLLLKLVQSASESLSLTHTQLPSLTSPYRSLFHSPEYAFFECHPNTSFPILPLLASLSYKHHVR